MKLLTFNVHGFKGFRGRDSSKHIFQLLEELQCDVVALQEAVWPTGVNSFGYLEQFAMEQNYNIFWAPTLQRRNMYYGNVFLSRYALERWKVLDLCFFKHEPRNAVELVLKVDGISVQIYVTHLGLRIGERRWQLNYLFSELEEQNQGLPQFLMGDLNLIGHPWDWASRWAFEHHFVILKRPSYPSVMPLFALDQIWARNIRSVRDFSALRADKIGGLPSDHLPFYAEVEI